MKTLGNVVRIYCIFCCIIKFIYADYYQLRFLKFFLLIKGIVMANFFTKTNKDMKYIFKKSANLNKKEKRRKKRGVMALIGLLLVLVELVISGLFLFEIFKLDIFPTKYFIMMIVILFLFCYTTLHHSLPKLTTSVSFYRFLCQSF